MYCLLLCCACRRPLLFVVCRCLSLVGVVVGGVYTCPLCAAVCCCSLFVAACRVLVFLGVCCCLFLSVCVGVAVWLCVVVC